MKKSYFFFLVCFMILCVTGIILVQWYFINTTIQNRDQEFSLAVKQSLNSVASDVQENELRHYIQTFEKLKDSIGKPDSVQLRNFFLFYDSDDESNLSSLFTFGLVEEKFNIAIPNDEIGEIEVSNVNDIKGFETTRIFKQAFDRENQRKISSATFQKMERISAIDQATYSSIFSKMANSFPIHKRINSFEIASLLQREFNSRNIQTEFEFGVFSNGLATKIISKNYEGSLSGHKYSIPIFVDEQGSSLYNLVVTFPKKEKYLISSVIGVASLSFILTILIILLCAISLFQILKQKKISEIKSDFINNMSHEFKTPIATINLAIDAIESQLEIKDSKKKHQYLKIMREENKRMHDQVETILTISQLDKSNTLIDKTDIDLHKIIKDSLGHIALLVQNKSVEIKTSFKSKKTKIFGNRNHLVNVFTNILDNAIKYSKENPIIKIETLNDDKSTYVEIEDKGIGMNDDTLKMIFEKFFREQNGDVHNIKGHGLGLAYVKKIVSLHNGKISVESTEGQGTKFKIQFPLFI